MTARGDLLVLAESSGSTEVGFHYVYAFDLDGAPEADFGDGGSISLNIKADKLFVTEDAIHPLGAHHDAIAFPKYGLDGALDTTFGNQDPVGGLRYMAAATPLQDVTEVRDFIIDDDGTIRVGAQTAPSTSGFHRDWGLARFTQVTNDYRSDQFLDFKFTSTRNVLHDLVHRHEGGYLAAGQSYEDNKKSAYVLAMRADGQVDDALGDNGTFEFSFSDMTNNSEIVALWPDGEAYRLLGNIESLRAGTSDPSRIVVRRFDPHAEP